MLDYAHLQSCYPQEDKPSADGYANQCAIRLSYAMLCAGWDFSDYTEPQTSEGYARGAQSLAWYLWKHLGIPKKYPGRESGVAARLATTQGIIFFRNIRGFRGGIGDHIDLWDGRSTKGAVAFGRCQEVWTWRL